MKRSRGTATLGTTSGPDLPSAAAVGPASPPPAHERSDPLWSVDDLAAHLGVPVATVYRWSSRRDGPPGYRVGRYLRFRPAEVQHWLDSRRHDDRAPVA